MSQKNKTEKILKYLESSYDSRSKWLQMGKLLKNRFRNGLNDNPILKWLLILGILTNLGIWLDVVISLYH